MKKHFEKTTKATKIILAGLIMTIAMGTVASAADAPYQNGTDVKFTKFYIKKNGNGYRRIVTGNKKNAGKTLYVEVQHMYDSDGDAADYTYSIWKVKNVTGDTQKEQTVTKGMYTPITLSEKMRTTDNVKVSVEGNSPNVSARISGYIYNFTGTSFGSNDA